MVCKLLNFHAIFYTLNSEYKTTLNAFTRNRKMTFEDYVWYLTLQKGRTTSMELDQYLRNKNDSYEITISKQAFSKQRLNLKPQIFIDLYKTTVKNLMKKVRKLYQQPVMKKHQPVIVLKKEMAMLE